MCLAFSAVELSGVDKALGRAPWVRASLVEERRCAEEWGSDAGALAYRRRGQLCVCCAWS